MMISDRKKELNYVLKNCRYSLILISILLFVIAPVKTFAPDHTSYCIGDIPNLPDGYYFGSRNTNTGQWSIVKFNGRNGGHYYSRANVTQQVGMPELGTNDTVSFGLVRHKGNTYFNFKAATYSGDPKFGKIWGNPKLPKLNPDWHEVAHGDYVQEILNDFVQRTKTPISLDPETSYNSKLFPFNKGKWSSKWGDIQDDAHSFLPRAVTNANNQLIMWKLGNGHFNPKHMQPNGSDGMLAAWGIKKTTSPQSWRGTQPASRATLPDWKGGQTTINTGLQSGRLYTANWGARSFANGAGNVASGFGGGIVGGYVGKEVEAYVTDGQGNGNAGEVIGGGVGGMATSFGYTAATVGVEAVTVTAVAGAASFAVAAGGLIYSAKEINSGVMNSDMDTLGEMTELQDALGNNGAGAFFRSYANYWTTW